MSHSRQLIVMSLCAAVALGVVVPQFIRADAPATAPATVKGARPIAAIEADLKETQARLTELVPYPKLLGDTRFRKENSEKVIPHLKRMADLLNEVATTQNMPEAARSRMQCLSMAVALGDKDSAATLSQVAAGKNADESLDAKSWLALGSWANASDDARGQQKVLDDYTVAVKDAVKNLADLTAEKNAATAAATGKPADPAAQQKAVERDAAIAKAHARQESIAETLMIMSQLGPANDEMAKKPVALIKSTLNSQGAKQVAAMMEADQAHRNLLGHPIRIVGRTTVNGKFNVSDWKGKVVLIDFWATWCGPCVEALPQIKKLYNDYHAKGLEVVGIDSDFNDDRVNSFTKENAMPWPQLREQTQNEDDSQHPLAKRYGVDEIPAVFLIDRKGVLRYTDGDEDTENKIKKLLEEPDPNVPPAHAPAPVPAPAPAK